ncbi:hypothetical protein ILYODFUR_035895 [Ilyodon furcidens]|uniref:Uncharacterized protein n=1 Tax=Ilyodon furcidens TaxID=33524 RepID=A0ABV0SUI0_9TELE
MHTARSVIQVWGGPTFMPFAYRGRSVYTSPLGYMDLWSQDDQAARSQGFLRLHQDCQKEMQLCSAEALS